MPPSDGVIALLKFELVQKHGSDVINFASEGISKRRKTNALNFPQREKNIIFNRIVKG